MEKSNFINSGIYSINFPKCFRTGVLRKNMSFAYIISESENDTSDVVSSYFVL